MPDATVQRVFLAGAAGVVGRRLAPMLLRAGHAVVGTTRSPARAAALEVAGVEPAVVDAFDADALARVLARRGPTTVIHLLTDLPAGLAPAAMAEGVRRNARVRIEGTRNLVRAARCAGAERIIAGSIAWAYAPGPTPHREGDPLDHAAEGDRAISVGGVAALEVAVLGEPGLVGVVLRFGQLYGPGTGCETPAGPVPLHVDAAAHAVVLAMAKHVAGVFNVAEPNPKVAVGEAAAGLGWHHDFRLDPTDV